MSKNWLKIGFGSGSRSEVNLSRCESVQSLKGRYSRFKPKQEQGGDIGMNQSRSKRSLISLEDLNLNNSEQQGPNHMRHLAWSKLTAPQYRNEESLIPFDKQSNEKVKKSAIHILNRQENELKVKRLHIEVLKQGIFADINQLKKLCVEVKIVVENMLKMFRVFCADTTYQISKFQNQVEKKLQNKVLTISKTSSQINQLRNGISRSYADLSLKLPLNEWSDGSNPKIPTARQYQPISMKKQQAPLSARSIDKRRIQKDQVSTKAHQLSQVIQRMKTLLGKKN